MAVMNAEQIFKTIEKQNGKMFARVMRGDNSAVPEGHPYRNINLLATPGLVEMLKYAGNDEKDAIALIPVIKERLDKSLAKHKKEEKSFEDPITLLDKAGYRAWYVNDPDNKEKSRSSMVRDQNSIAGYFRDQRAVNKNMTGKNARSDMHELICTVYTSWDSGENGLQRFDNNYIINAVRKEAWDDDKLPESEWHIKPSEHPRREDAYGTSVISIQILKTGGGISIKNRYNHTLKDEFPDNTYNNNPDNIIPGLSDALKRKFGVDFVISNSHIPFNYKFINNQLIRFNYEVNNVYFGDGFYFEGSDITELNDEHEVLMDTVLLDTDYGKKARSVLNTPDEKTDELARVINNEIAGCKVKKRSEKGEIIITTIDENKQKKELARIKNGRITSLHLYKTTEIGDSFLDNNTSLKEFVAPNLKKMGGWCFNSAKDLEKIEVPALTEMGAGCFRVAKSLKEFVAPKLGKMGYKCFNEAENLEKIEVSALTEMGNYCFGHVKLLKKFVAPKLGKMGYGCFNSAPKLEKIDVSALTEMGEECFKHVESLKEFVAPKLGKMGYECFYEAPNLKKIEVSALTEMDNNCFESVKSLKEFVAPKLGKMGDACFGNAENLEKIEVSALTEMGSRCFYENTSLKEFVAPKLGEMGDKCFNEAENLEKIEVSALTEMGADCFRVAKSLKEFVAPKLGKMGSDCFYKAPNLEKIDVSVLTKMGNRCFENVNSLKEFVAPKLGKMGYECFYEAPNLKKIEVSALTEM
ncbi:MAG: leucine-rich repeat domain-containing protein, partial [Alphaproteobacteria bacterium]|nr:leucine-rich repeat domain-containing protein [Alphaproteobacteria bacterium]